MKEVQDREVDFDPRIRELEAWCGPCGTMRKCYIAGAMDAEFLLDCLTCRTKFRIKRSLA